MHGTFIYQLLPVLLPSHLIEAATYDGAQKQIQGNMAKRWPAAAITGTLDAQRLYNVALRALYSIPAQVYSDFTLTC